jgi:hypothetical protein
VVLAARCCEEPVAEVALDWVEADFVAEVARELDVAFFAGLVGLFVVLLPAPALAFLTGRLG